MKKFMILLFAALLLASFSNVASSGILGESKMEAAIKKALTDGIIAKFKAENIDVQVNFKDFKITYQNKDTTAGTVYYIKGELLASLKLIKGQLKLLERKNDPTNPILTYVSAPGPGKILNPGDVTPAKREEFRCRVLENGYGDLTVSFE